ncbi:g10788 [Coccomyxa elongata]
MAKQGRLLSTGGAEQKGDDEQQDFMQQAKASSCQEHPRAAIPEVPAGPLVISAGWGRTGTSSLKVALDQLGYSPCFHARFMPYITDLFDAMYDFAEGRRPDFPAKQLFRQFNAAVDIPAPLIPLVLEAYPDAKVILTVRDPEKWYESYISSLLWLYQTWLFKPFAYILPMGQKLQAIGRWWLVWEFGDDTMLDKDACIKAYLQHNAHIRATIPPERLLEWEAKDGWGPLCRFLGHSAPKKPFPRKNEGASEMAWQIVRFIMRNPLAAMGLIKYQHKGPLDFDAV